MKNLRKKMGISISALLLLCFSITFLPLGFLHNHSVSSQVSCQGTDGHNCKHKVHLSVKSDFCFACTIHYDKEFTKAIARNYTIFTPSISFLHQNKVSKFIVELIFTSLRGPPVNE